MPYKDRRTPGVYITELAAFPPSIVGVATAVPAFIGYTATAEINGKPAYLKPIRIGSLADYEEIFGGDYAPIYQIIPAPAVPNQSGTDTYDFSVLNVDASPPQMEYYLLKQTHDTQFNLYNSMRLFYANGGGNCYVVSVGNYSAAAEAARDAAATEAARDASAAKAPRGAIEPFGPGLEPTPVKEDALLNGLEVIKDQSGPTMLVIPEAVLLKPSGYQTVIQEMLKQCAELQDRVAILDVYGGKSVAKRDLDAVMSAFREDVGTENLSYGMAYFPFLDTNIVEADDFTFNNLTPIGVDSPVSSPGGLLADAPPNDLQTILGWVNRELYYDYSKPDGGGRYMAVQEYIDAMPYAATEKEVKTLNQNLVAALPLLGNILEMIAHKNDKLPPSGAMAGIYTYIDFTRGVWNAPANTTLSKVDKPTYKLDDKQQADLNVPVDGKAVNAIREFVGRGTIVWGARTLDGNSNDYRYIQVRRTLIYIEQSIKSALDRFVFAANDGNTWVTVTSMVSNFLQDLWSRGGLMGATAAEAFDVTCGLGSTMTPMDVLQGYMIVQVRVQMIRPAEFIELTFKQKMQGLS